MIPKISPVIEAETILGEQFHCGGGGGHFFVVVSRSGSMVTLKPMRSVRFGKQEGALEPGIPDDNFEFRRKVVKGKYGEYVRPSRGSIVTAWDGKPYPFWPD